ncbi:MAG: PilN domain-containing protein [Burkholderiaceae bacterium]
MILINLLPHREAARKRRKDQFLVFAASAAVLGAALSALVHTSVQAEVDAQRARNAYLQEETGKLEAQIKDIAGLQAEIASLKARQAAVENLQSDRNTPVHLLDELVNKLPDGVYLVSMKQENQSVQLVGVAQSQERVSELLRNLNGSKWLSRPELVEIVSTVQAISPREQRRVSNFTVRAGLTRPDTATPAPGAQVPPRG